MIYKNKLVNYLKYILYNFSFLIFTLKVGNYLTVNPIDIANTKRNTITANATNTGQYQRKYHH